MLKQLLHLIWKITYFKSITLFGLEGNFLKVFNCLSSYLFIFERGSCHVVQVNLELLGSNNPSDSDFQLAGTVVTCYHTKAKHFFKNMVSFA